MNRWKIALLLPVALLLGGCVTYPTYVYSDGYGSDSRYVGSGSYYRPAYSEQGDYYYRPTSSGHTSISYSSSWWYAPDYTRHSAYYSIFWPIHRGFHDPYWYPGFYYGVTYFPRNYFSISLHQSFRPHRAGYWGHPRHNAFVHWYSPYRHSWVDSYYHWDRHAWGHPGRDNRRGHGRFDHAYSSSLYRPRYGHARNQAERLAWGERALAPSVRGDGIATGLSTGRGSSAFERNSGRAAGYAGDRGYADRVANAREADYRSRSSAREPLPTRGFGVPATSPRSGRAESYGRGAENREARTFTDERFRGAATRSAGVEGSNTPRYRESASERRQAYDARELAPQSRGDWRSEERARSRSFDGGSVERGRQATLPQRPEPGLQRIESQPLRASGRDAGREVSRDSSYGRVESGRTARYAPEYRGSSPQRPMANERAQPAAPMVRGRYESAPAPTRGSDPSWGGPRSESPRSAQPSRGGAGDGQSSWGEARSESPRSAPPGRGGFGSGEASVESRSAPVSRGSSESAPSGRTSSRAREASRFED
ncbi:MAG: hypothetical protein MEQ07_11540 [Aquimonas sp.]|nr:hypothetical protein [Aquimonas sp.]